MQFFCTILHLRISSSTCYHRLWSRPLAAGSLCHGTMSEKCPRGSPTFLTLTRPLTRARGRPTYTRLLHGVRVRTYTYMYQSKITWLMTRVQPPLSPVQSSFYGLPCDHKYFHNHWDVISKTKVFTSAQIFSQSLQTLSQKQKCSPTN